MAPKGSSSKAKPAKKLFSFSKLPRSSEGGSSWKAGKRRGGKKVSKATYALVAAEFQKGDKAKQRSGNIYVHAKPRYGQNEAFKTALGKHTLSEKLRWNDEAKVYTVKIYTPKQARMLLSAARSLEGAEEDLPEDIEAEIFDGAKTAAVDVVPMTIEDEDVLAVGGTTFPFKETLKELGFTYFNDDGMSWWIKAKEDVDVDEVTALFEEYGFAVEVYDGVDDDK
jgi:hypothetical protein